MKIERNQIIGLSLILPICVIMILINFFPEKLGTRQQEINAFIASVTLAIVGIAFLYESRTMKLQKLIRDIPET